VRGLVLWWCCWGGGEGLRFLRWDEGGMRLVLDAGAVDGSGGVFGYLEAGGSEAKRISFRTIRIVHRNGGLLFLGEVRKGS